VSRSLASLFAAAALFAAGGLFGVAMAPGRSPAPVSVAASPQPPAEVRTIIKRRTVHVYRKPKRSHLASQTAAAPVPVAPAAPAAPAPVRASSPVAPRPASAPLVTRTSGSGAAGHSDDGGEHESGQGDD
jgi:hypothetical protein